MVASGSPQPKTVGRHEGGRDGGPEHEARGKRSFYGQYFLTITESRMAILERFRMAC